MSDSLCEIPPEPLDFICNMNNISYYIAKVTLETNPASTPIFKKTGIKTGDGYNIYTLQYSPATSGGYIGAIGGEIAQMTSAMSSMTDVFDVDPQYSCIQCLNEDPKFIYSKEWSKLTTAGITESGCSEIYNTNRLYDKCKEVTSGFQNIDRKYKKEIFNLYLLGFGTLLVFLSYKLLMKKN